MDDIERGVFMRKKKIIKKLTQKNMILEKELGLKRNEYGINEYILKDRRISRKRLKRFYKQYKKYGFTDYDTWSLDHAFAEWMYSRLYMYLEYGGKIVNLDYHKFKYKDKEYTQRQIILKIMDACECYIRNQFCGNVVNEEISYKAMQEACELWALVFPAMWW